jgi:hypothetical protein
MSRIGSRDQTQELRSNSVVSSVGSRNLTFDWSLPPD